ncbi:MAG: imidazole glycerol phosphate synthase subunit HisH [Clostridiales bacterium]|nr:imidazole glycerol phosphate synthase subunit HisH [Clostridiales bacterium]
MIAIIDYGCGNLFSLSSSLAVIGEEWQITADKDRLAKADKLILPGVGAFGDAADKLHKTGLDEVLREAASAGKYILGICLGMQLLFEKSYEYGEHAGLGLLKGTIEPLARDIQADLKIPHMGWNNLHVVKQDPILRRNHEGDSVYFVHSFYAKNCEESLLATAEYDVTVPALVGKDNVYGAQFHPEKSGEVGLNLLKSFAELG